MLPWLQVTQGLPAPSVKLLMHTFFMVLLLLERWGSLSTRPRQRRAVLRPGRLALPVAHPQTVN